MQTSKVVWAAAIGCVFALGCGGAAKTNGASGGTSGAPALPGTTGSGGAAASTGPGSSGLPTGTGGTASAVTGSGGTGGGSTLGSGGSGQVGGTAGSGSNAGGTGGETGGGAGGGASAGGSSGTPPTTAAPCTGKPGSKRGKSMQTVMAGGASRTFVYYAPMGLDANTPVPMVIVPHGFTMSGEAMFEITGYDKVADRDKFVVAYPDGEGVAGSAGGISSPWNVGSGVCGVGAAVAATGNDQAFVDAMIAFADADQCIDHQHIFMSGFSMGGYFSNETGCMNPQIKGIGPHSGGTHDLSGCKNAKMPALILHGDADPLIGYSCGTDARDKWAARNGCMPASAGVDTVMVKMGKCEYNKGCPAGAQVGLCTFSGMGHGWAGGTTGTSAGATFAFPGYESATELGWSFFKKYAW